MRLVEDVRFVLDCAFNSAEFVYCPDSVAFYRIHEDGSLSTQDPIEFTRCAYSNVMYAKEWWLDDGGIDGRRKGALLKSFGFVARASYENDRNMFDKACKELFELSPKYVPDGPRLLSLVSGILGYRKAEAMALCYRRVKSQIRSI